MLVGSGQVYIMFYLKIQDAFEYQLFKNLGARAEIGNGPVILNVIPFTLVFKMAIFQKSMMFNFFFNLVNI